MTQKPNIASLKPTISTIDTRQGSRLGTKRIRGWQLTKIRDRILLRDAYTCRKCGRVSIHLEIDHIVPLHLGGAESDENRQCLCSSPCHSDKTALEEKERDTKY
jgi:5-methylcytosine-specific restriction protein A